eukprot:755848-Pyramimonas_sp.AAC.1
MKACANFLKVALDRSKLAEMRALGEPDQTHESRALVRKIKAAVTAATTGDEAIKQFIGGSESATDVSIA